MKKKKAYSLMGIMLVLMIITVISAYSLEVVLNSKREGVTRKYEDIYRLSELEEILSVVNLYLKEDTSNIKDTIKDGASRNINVDSKLSIIYSSNYDQIQINYIYNGISKGHFFRYKYIENHIVLLPSEEKYG